MNGWHAYDEWERTMTMSPETRDAVREGAKRSAAAILPFVFETIGNPKRMLEVGSGEGHWGREAMNHGVHTLCMLDVDDSAQSVNHWDAERGDKLPMDFAPDEDGYDEATGQTSGQSVRWPLALCLETAEHLTPAAGDHLVAELCRVADEIVWSAAIPGQGGDGHINEQWPQYWANRFNAHGYVLDDPWRLDLWDDPDVEPWYAQNLLYAFKPAHGWVAKPTPHALVHPVTWAHHRGVTAPGAV